MITATVAIIIVLALRMKCAARMHLHPHIRAMFESNARTRPTISAFTARNEREKARAEKIRGSALIMKIEHYRIFK